MSAVGTSKLSAKIYRWVDKILVN